MCGVITFGKGYNFTYEKSAIRQHQSSQKWQPSQGWWKWQCQVQKGVSTRLCGSVLWESTKRSERTEVMHARGFNFEYIPSHRDSKQGETNPDTRFVLHGGMEAIGTRNETLPTQTIWYYIEVPSYCFGSATSRYKSNTGHIWVVHKVPKLIQEQNIHEQ